MGEASLKLKLTNKQLEMFLEHPERLELKRFEFASVTLCIYMHVLYIIMNMIITGDNS